MRVVFDTCVLVPSFLRAVLLACATQSRVEVIVSPRILGEWLRAGKTPLQRLEAEAAIVRFRREFETSIRPDPTSLAEFWLPDRDDIHILGLAVGQHADVIVTHNKKDFPQDELRSYGLERMDPDTFLRQLLKHNANGLAAVVQPIMSNIQSAHPDVRALDIWRKAWLPQFGRLIEKL
jgi:predicted nucleic acid-binding protein